MDIDISKISEPDQEEKIEEKDPNYGVKEDGKSIIVMIVVTVGLFALLLGGFKFYGSITSADVVNIDEMHKKNLDGNLDDGEGYVYNGFSFVKADGLWWTELKRIDTLIKIPLHFGPKELEEIKFTGQLSEDFNKGNDVYISIDPEVISGHYVIAMREISSNVGQGINRNSIGACSKEHEGCLDRKILNCKNTEGLPVVELEVSDKPGIELSGTCIKVKGTEYGIIKAANRLLYNWYGVMD